MVLGERASADGEVDTLASFQGAEVHLRSITPATLTSMATESKAGSKIPQKLLEYRPDSYKLGYFDVVQVTVWEHPELTLPLGPYRSDNAIGQMVNENGELFFPYAGQLNVLGKSITELKEDIVSALSKVLNNPQIDIRLIKSQSQRAYVQGAVSKAGVVSLSDVPVTLLEALNMAGGVSNLGDPTRVELSRDGETTVVDLLGVYPFGEGPADILLKSGDVIRVASATEAQAYILGEVSKQQALPFVNGKMTLSQAIATVGGLQALSAQSRGIYVIRGGANPADTIRIFHLDSRNPLALVFGDHFELEPRDVVFVDATGLARWNRVMTQILPTAQAVYYTAQSVHGIKVAKDDILNW
jgi:polysaccharide export outer membrane protein